MAPEIKVLVCNESGTYFKVESPEVITTVNEGLIETTKYPGRLVASETPSVFPLDSTLESIAETWNVKFPDSIRLVDAQIITKNINHF